jgi:hypothetical protein
MDNFVASNARIGKYIAMAKRAESDSKVSLQTAEENQSLL